MKKAIKIGVSGDMGSFSEAIALQYLQQKKITAAIEYLIDMEGVLAAIEQQTIELGIFPVVNLHGGLVKSAFIAMGKHTFTPIDDIWLDVKQCLIAAEPLELSEIKTIVSHPQALAQCKNYLEKQLGHAKIVEYQDTAQAARHLSENKFTTNCAVIAAKQTAKQFNLTLLAEGIHDQQPNLTTFVVVKNYLTPGDSSW